MGFILKLKKSDAKKTLEDGASNARSSKFFDYSNQSRMQQEQKDMETFLGTLKKAQEMSKTKISLRTIMSFQKRR